MATQVITHSTAVTLWPLSTVEDEKIDQGVRPGGATPIGTALSVATVDQQDTSDSDDQSLAGEKELEVQADTKDRPRPRRKSQPQPQLQPPAADAGADAIEPSVLVGPKAAPPTKHGAGSGKTKETDAEKQQNGASAASRTAGAGSETDAADAADAGADDKSCLPFRCNKAGPRKGGKGKEKGALGRAFEKLTMRLFGKKKKEVVEENPYAAPITPYQQARANLNQSPKVGGPGGLPSNPRANSFASTAPSFASSTAPPPYLSPATTYDSPSTASDSSRFGDEKYGNQNGYGSNRYDSQARSGGYGGFGDDAGNNDLFGGASGRYVPPQQGSNGTPSMQTPAGRYNNDPSKSTLLGNAQDRYNPMPPAQSQDQPADDEYGGYGAPRELTEEERDKQETRAINQETRNIRNQDVDMMRRMLATAEQTNEIGMHAAATLGAQGDRLAKTERNMDAAQIKARESEVKTKELKKINGSMFSGMIGPSNKTLRKQDEATLEQYQTDKRTREETARDGYQSNQHMEQLFANGGNSGSLGMSRPSQAKSSKFVFVDEEDMSDEEMEQVRQDHQNEDEINRGLELLHGHAQRMKGTAMGLGEEFERQNSRIDRIGQKTDAVDDRVRMNREKLSRIR
ncbi:Protein transport protein S9 plasma membrane t-SNARE [Diaporthe australafricana]|uniref:Protein transport protein S9 plasma membrane t-SNARE n=1 Tax=Diaporthe australafricana TaxID=127596 RepID=A0ABR3WLH3_9PEZI